MCGLLRGQSEQDLINLISEVLKDGRPKLIIADQYSAMKGKKFKEFLRENGIKIEYICVDSPESNGTNERVGQTLGNAIRCKLYDKAYSCASRLRCRTYNRSRLSDLRY